MQTGDGHERVPNGTVYSVFRNVHNTLMKGFEMDEAGVKKRRKLGAVS